MKGWVRLRELLRFARVHTNINTHEDLTQSFSDKSRGLPQTSHSTEQSVFSSECVRVDTNLNVHEDIQLIQLTAV